MKWEAKKTELGLSDADMSLSVRKKIAEYNDLEETLVLLKKGTGNEHKIETVQNGILQLDATLTRDMVRLADPKNKERYSKMAAKLTRKGQGKPKKAEPVKTVEPKAAEPVAPAAVIEPDAPKPPEAKKIQTPPSPTPPGKTKATEPAKTSDKKDNTVLIVAGVVLTAVAGFFGIRWYMRKSG